MGSVKKLSDRLTFDTILTELMSESIDFTVFMVGNIHYIKIKNANCIQVQLAFGREITEGVR
jgi:hypothetical protein